MTKKLVLNGPVISSNHQRIYDWLGQDAVSPQKVSDLLAAASGEELEIRLSSPGGDVYAASEIYANLNEYTGRIVVVVTGIAASAASILAMAADEVKMYETALLMIHNPQTGGVSGDYRNMEQAAAFLRSSNEVVVAAYVNKTGKSKEELFDLMDKTTFFSPQEALDAGFIDEIITGAKNQPMSVAADMFGSLIPDDRAEAVLALIASTENPMNLDNQELEQAKARHQFLKLNEKRAK